MIDVLIAGGGPAGLATGILAARAGLEAVVVEPRRGVLDKACGEGLMPAAVRALEELGIALPVAHPFVGIRYVDGPVVAEGSFPGRPGLGVRRVVLHEALQDRARAAGVQFVEGRVGAVEQTADRVSAAGVTARFLVAADGLNSPIRRQLGLETRARRAARFGLRRHFTIAPWADRVEVHWAERAEAYVTPVGPDTVGVALLVPDAAPGFEGWLDRFPALRDRLGPPCTDVRGAGPFERRARHRVRGRVLLVGDAAGFLDPITGEGVRLGLCTAKSLIDCLVRGRPAAYDRAWARAVRRYWWMTSGLLRLTRCPALRRRLVPALRRSPRAFDYALKLLAG